MTKIAVILILMGLTVMASAYNLRQTGEKDENAEFKESGIHT